MWQHWVSVTLALHCANPRLVSFSESWISDQRFLVTFYQKTPSSCFPGHHLLLYKMHSCKNVIAWTEKPIVQLRLPSGLVEVFAPLGCYAVHQTRRVETSSVQRRKSELCGHPLFNCCVAWNYSCYQHSNNNNSSHKSSIPHNCSIVLK